MAGTEKDFRKILEACNNKLFKTSSVVLFNKLTILADLKKLPDLTKEDLMILKHNYYKGYQSDRLAFENLIKKCSMVSKFYGLALDNFFRNMSEEVNTLLFCKKLDETAQLKIKKLGR